MKIEYNLVLKVNINSWSSVVCELEADLCPGVCGGRREEGGDKNLAQCPRCLIEFQLSLLKPGQRAAVLVFKIHSFQAFQVV